MEGVKDMTDERIIEMYNARAEDAINATKEKYGRYCYSIAYNILRKNEDAEECENDTYLCAWNSIPPAKPKVLSSFLGVITRRISLDRYRKQNADKRGGGDVALSFDELEECISDGKSIDDNLDAKSIADIVSSFLYMLKETECNVFLRRYFYFDSIDDICMRYGYSKSKVKMMLCRTREKLKSELEKEGVVV